LKPRIRVILTCYPISDVTAPMFEENTAKEITKRLDKHGFLDVWVREVKVDKE